MNRSTFVFLAALVTSACGSVDRVASITALTGVAANGQTPYVNTCSSCHKADGTGDSSRTADGGVLYPSLKAKVLSLTQAQFVSITLNGLPGTSMVSFSYLTDQQLADIYAYVKSL